jgi:ATP-dependent protease Clp ATPase subunit
MERLTAPRCSGIKSGYWSTAKKEELVQRLGQYEDTGLTPEEIKDGLDQYVIGQDEAKDGLFQTFNPD